MIYTNHRRPLLWQKRKETRPQSRDDRRQTPDHPATLQEYDIEIVEDIYDALKDLLGGTIKEMMEAEMDDYRNGYKEKTVNSSYGSMRIDVPQDRKSTFEPKVLKKRQKDISDIDQKIISMYAKGMTTARSLTRSWISMVLRPLRDSYRT